MLYIRAAVLTNFQDVARSVGIDPQPFLQAADFDAAILGDPDRMVPRTPVVTVLEEAARQSGCEQLGLLMAERRSLGSIGPISLALAHKPSLGTIIEALVRHQRLFGNALQMESVVIDDAAYLRIDPIGSNLSRQGTELAVALLSRCIATILNRRSRPERIQFVHSAPADLGIHRRVFMCPIVFDSDCNAIVFARDALQETNPTGDAELALHAERLLALLLPAAEIQSAGDRVRQSLRRLLPEHRGSLDEVARASHATPRSLQRRLHREGHSFGQLLDEVRGELALQYLSASHSMTQVALLVGYQSSCSFARWFKARFGMSPLDWRRGAIADRPPRLRQEDVAPVV